MESVYEQVIHGRRCKHGTPIGTPGGADLMCGYCEDGTTDAEFEAICRWEAREEQLRRRRHRVADMVTRESVKDPQRMERILNLYRRITQQIHRCA